MKELREEWGYALERVRPVDMFPHTPHVEAVALLTRRLSSRLDRLAQLAEVVAERDDALGAEPLLDRLARRRGNAAAPAPSSFARRIGGQADEVRAPVVGVRDPLDVAALLEPADAEEHGRERHLQPVGQQRSASTGPSAPIST